MKFRDLVMELWDNPEDQNLLNAVAEIIRDHAPEGSQTKEASLEEIRAEIPDIMREFLTKYGFGISGLSPADARELLRGDDEGADS